MKVILRQDVKTIGRKGAILDVSDGYARNYLIPRGLAVPQGDRQAREVMTEVAAGAKRREAEQERKQRMRGRLVSHVFTFERRATEQGSLYAGVTPAEIAEAVRRFTGVGSLEKVEVPEPIRTVGSHEAFLHEGNEKIPLKISVKAT